MSNSYTVNQRGIKVFAAMGRLDFCLEVPGEVMQRASIPTSEKYEEYSLGGKPLRIVPPVRDEDGNIINPNPRQIKIVWGGKPITTGWTVAKNGGKGYFYGSIDPSNEGNAPSTPEDIFEMMEW